MGITKSHIFKSKENKLAKYAKALGHPARISILNLLAKKQACICGDIVDELPLSQSTVSQHLKELKNCGLINGTTHKTSSIYSLNKFVLKEFESEFKKMMKSLKSKK